MRATTAGTIFIRQQVRQQTFIQNNVKKKNKQQKGDVQIGNLKRRSGGKQTK